MGFKRFAGISLLLFIGTNAWSASSSSRCARCHPIEVEGFARSAMSQSLRKPANEPSGTFVHPYSGTKFTIYTNSKGYWQRLERDGSRSEYKVAYVIGSGRHAMGYLVRMGDHLFQSPITFYAKTQSYDMAPGYEENRTPDFIRPVSEECLACHSGKPLHIPGTLSEYRTPAFAEEGIYCDRCHGDPTEHLRNPVPGSIINPAKLPIAARNSICEQCHLKGMARVLNPGKDFLDFRPGQTLEQTFSIYTLALPPGAPPSGFKVISHVEQLALSMCVKKSEGRLWCATCHNPHDKVQQPPEYFRAKCLACHAGKLAKSHPEGYKGNCVGCHMPTRNAKDGGHTVFTDHHISRRPHPDQERDIPVSGDLVAWRQPPPNLRVRNLAIAYITAGLENQVPSQVAKGYPMLLEAEKQFPDDPALLSAKGRALMWQGKPTEAAEVFERVLELRPGYALDEGNAGKAWMRAGQLDRAVVHLERAIKIDPLLIPVAEMLVQVYRRQGDMDKLAALAEHIRNAMGDSAPQEDNSQ